MKEFGGWYYDLSRQWDGGFDHLGPPEPDNDSYAGWDATGACLLAYAMPLKSLWFTGKRPGKVPQLDAAAAEEFILTGRGWNNKDRYSFYDKLSVDELLADLGSWSPIVRQRAGIAFGRRKDAPVSRVVALLDSPSLDAAPRRVPGARSVQGPGYIRGSGAAQDASRRRPLAAHQLRRLRLAAIGKSAMEAVPEMIELLAQFDTHKTRAACSSDFLRLPSSIPAMGC